MTHLLLFCTVTMVTLSWVDSQRMCPDKRIRYTVTNMLKPPFFSKSAELIMFCQSKFWRNEPLIKYMERSVLEFPVVFTRYKATFMNPWGYYIDSINDRDAVYAEDQSYWSILNQDGFLQKGVSTYIPQPGDQIVFNLTRYTGSHP